MKMTFGKKHVIGGTAAAVIAMASPFVLQWEGLRTVPYKDVIGVWTDCVGNTHNVVPGRVRTEAECLALLDEHLRTYYAEIERCMTNKTIPVGVQASLLELAINVGAPKVCTSTMMRKANAGDYVGACNELRRWIKAGGVRWKGLENRRAASKEQLCLSGL